MECGLNIGENGVWIKPEEQLPNEQDFIIYISKEDYDIQIKHKFDIPDSSDIMIGQYIKNNKVEWSDFGEYDEIGVWLKIPMFRYDTDGQT